MAASTPMNVTGGGRLGSVLPVKLCGVNYSARSAKQEHDLPIVHETPGSGCGGADAQ